MLRKILVAIDLSTMSRKVFEVGLSFAKTTGARLMLLHILSSEDKDCPTPLIYSGLEYAPSAEPLLKAYKQQWQKFEQQGIEYLRSLTEEANKAGVKTEFTQTQGYPGRNICELAQTWSAELIVVGSRGLTGLKEMFLGSISNYVTHHAPCSVLIVREEEEVRSPKIGIIV